MMKIAHEMITLKTADLLLLGGTKKGIMPSHILWHIECNGTTLPPDPRSQVRKAPAKRPWLSTQNSEVAE